MTDAADGRLFQPPEPEPPPFVRSDRMSLLDPDDLTHALWDDSVDPTVAAGPDVIRSLGVRTRALAHTRPLHELEANKARLGGEAWSRLNLIELGFHAIDTVALRMDFDSGARHDDVLAAIATLARYQDSSVDDAERVADRVLEGLITGRGGSDAEAHQGTYGTWGLDGYEARRFDYALLTEHVDDTGEYYLRATDPAISVLMGALELDVESAQLASELRLNELVKRGLLTAAIQEAERARYRSIRYAEQLRRQLSRARLHNTEPGTLEAVDELVDHALEHVIDRYRAERSIIANVAAARDEAVDRTVQARASRLIEALEQSERRHQYLQTRLVRARSEFRALLTLQLAVAPTAPSRIDLERQLVVPLLIAPLVAADRIGQLAFRLSAAPDPPALVELDRLGGLLCAAPTAGAGIGAVVDDDVELVDAPARRRFDDDTWDAVDAVLESIVHPVLLSDLLDRTDVADADGSRSHLLALRAAHTADPALSEHLRMSAAGGAGSGGWSDRGLLVATPTGRRYVGATIAGDDLELVPAWLSMAPDEGMPPDPFTSHERAATGDDEEQ